MTETKVLQGAGTQPLRKYADRRQVTVAEWVTLQPIFDVCKINNGYEGGGRLRFLLWRQEAADNQLKVTVASI